MLRILKTLLCSFSFLMFAVSVVSAQDAPAKEEKAEVPTAAEVSDAMTLAEPAAEPAAELDMTLFECPKDAKPAELFAFIDGLDAKVPQPKTAEEMNKIVEAMTKLYGEVAEKVLAHPEATPEEKDQANQLKFVALTAQSRTDDAAKAELEAFVDAQLAAAKDVAAKMKAYQMKLQSMLGEAQADPKALDSVSALADEILAKEKGEELQLLGLEVKSYALLSKAQADQKAIEELTGFLNGILADTAISQKMREKAQLTKVAAIQASSKSEEEKAAELDAYFDELLAGELSPEARKQVYMMRIQTVMPQQPQGRPGMAPQEAPAPADPAKVDKLVGQLLKEESEELKSLGYAVKSNALITAVQADPAKVDELFKFAEGVLASSPSPTVKEQMAGLMLQGFMFKIQKDKAAEGELLAFLDKMIAEKPEEKFLQQLNTIKLQVLSMQAQEDPAKAADLEKALNELGNPEGYGQMVPVAWATVYMAKVQGIADNKGTVADLDAVLTALKAKLVEAPILAVLVGDLKESIEKIGANNNDPELLNRVFTDFIKTCSSSDNDVLKQAAEMLDGILKLSALKGKEVSFEGMTIAPEENKKFQSSELNGKIYLVDLWTTSDPASFETVEELKELHTDFSPKGFQIVGINTDSDTRMLPRFLEVFSMPWIVISQKLSTDAKLNPLPSEFLALPAGTRILVGADGKVIMVTGDMDAVRKQLEEKLGIPEQKAEEAKPAEEKPAEEKK